MSSGLAASWQGGGGGVAAGYGDRMAGSGLGATGSKGRRGRRGSSAVEVGNAVKEIQ